MLFHTSVQVVDPNCSSSAQLVSAHNTGNAVLQSQAGLRNTGLRLLERLYSIGVFSFDTTGKVSALPSTTARVAAGSTVAAKALTNSTLMSGRYS